VQTKSNSDEASSQKKETFSQEEIAKFRAMAAQWWDTKAGPVRPLHSMNKLRVPFIRGGLLETGHSGPQKAGPKPLDGVKILDVGCGGGILCEPLARMGAKVTGVDVTSEAVDAACRHAIQSGIPPSTLQYCCEPIEKHVLANARGYDAVVASEVLEHVESLPEFLDHLCGCLRVGGCLFLTSINRTPTAFFLTIVGAEYIAGVVPKGTHSYTKFVDVDELIDLLAERQMETKKLHGMEYSVFKDEWAWNDSVSVNFALMAVKKAPEDVVNNDTILMDN